MKNFLFLGVASVLFISSCKTSQLVPNADDVYTNPSEELKLAKMAQEQKAKQLAEEEQQQAAARAAQKAKDDNNPYYKDPNYNSDDYYDYKYASRINRFSNPLSGAGYYDPYYTNTYTYNQNPAMYGTSIYSSYNYLMPSAQFGNYSTGLSMGLAYGYGYGYGYNSGIGYGACYNPYMSSYGGYYSSGYGMPMGYGCTGINYGLNPGYYGSVGYPIGYGGGYYNNYYNTGYYGNPYNNGYWGYYNSYDPNSAYKAMLNAPRNEDYGGVGRAVTDGGGRTVGEGDARQRYLETVAAQQNATPRFSNPDSRRSMDESNRTNGINPERVNQPRGDVYQNNGITNYPDNNRATNTRNNQTNSQSQPSGTDNPGRSSNGTRVTQMESDRIRSMENTNSNRTWGGNTWNNGGGGTWNSGGSSAPAPRSGGGGGGGNHPR